MRLLIDTHNMWFVYLTACPSHRHFIKVIIVLIVLLLSPVVTEAGLGSGRAVIGRDDPPPRVTVLPFCAYAQAQRPLSSDILFTPETQDGSCECLGPIAN